VGPGELIVYEVPLRTFTAHPNSNVGSGKQGTFLGFLEKVRFLHVVTDSIFVAA
jgi:pullulanase/glycogen debranching enzyme